jgi:FAD:protein FMN transferase
VAIEDAASAGASAGRLGLGHVALATGGDTYRSMVAEGVRYGHVLDARTGWPVQDAPRSVTAHAICTQAGPRDNHVRTWCYRQGGGPIPE